MSAGQVTASLTGLRGVEIPGACDVVRYENGLAHVRIEGVGVVVIGRHEVHGLRALVFTQSRGDGSRPAIEREAPAKRGDDGRVRVWLMPPSSDINEPRLDLWVAGLEDSDE